MREQAAPPSPRQGPHTRPRRWCASPSRVRAARHRRSSGGPAADHDDAQGADQAGCLQLSTCFCATDTPRMAPRPSRGRRARPPGQRLASYHAARRRLALAGRRPPSAAIASGTAGAPPASPCLVAGACGMHRYAQPAPGRRAWGEAGHALAAPTCAHYVPPGFACSSAQRRRLHGCRPTGVQSMAEVSAVDHDLRVVGDGDGLMRRFVFDDHRLRGQRFVTCRGVNHM